MQRHRSAHLDLCRQFVRWCSDAHCGLETPLASVQPPVSCVTFDGNEFIDQSFCGVYFFANHNRW